MTLNVYFYQTYEVSDEKLVEFKENCEDDLTEYSLYNYIVNEIEPIDEGINDIIIEDRNHFNEIINND